MYPLNVMIEGRNLTILPEWKEKVEEELGRIQKHYNEPILHARAEIIATAHHRHGAFEIRLIVNITGNVLTVTRQGEMVVPLIVEAFDVLDRRLRETSDTRQKKVKIHEEHISQGKIVSLFPYEDYGFIQTTEGGEVYFHANSVKNGNFEELQEGQKVKFVEEPGEKGPQAAWVRLTT
jgi:cold shock CspA family protein